MFIQGVPHLYGLHQYDFHQYEFYCHRYKISTSGGLVELLCSKISTSGNWLCSTHQYEFRIVRFFQNPKIRTKRGPPVHIEFTEKHFSPYTNNYVDCNHRGSSMIMNKEQIVYYMGSLPLHELETNQGQCYSAAPTQFSVGQGSSPLMNIRLIFLTQKSYREQAQLSYAQQSM